MKLKNSNGNFIKFKFKFKYYSKKEINIYWHVSSR